MDENYSDTNFGESRSEDWSYGLPQARRRLCRPNRFRLEDDIRRRHIIVAPKLHRDSSTLRPHYRLTSPIVALGPYRCPYCTVDDLPPCRADDYGDFQSPSG